MTIEREELEQITTQVWELIMDSQITPTTDSTLSDDVAPDIAHIKLQGAYEGRIALHVDQKLIRAAAATMFGVSDEQVTDEDLADTARELANMIGGNVKCLVEQPTDLGLPELTPANEFYATYPDASRRLAFQHGGAPFQVLVYDAGPSA